MNNISVFKKILPEDSVKFLLELRQKYTGLEDVEINSELIIKNLDIFFKPHVEEYVGESFFKNKLLPLEEISLIKQVEGQEPDTMHFDEKVTNNQDLVLAPFVCLIYLTTSGVDFNGGELYFPFQKKIITPEAGDLVIFPTGYLYPHKALPFNGGDRYLVKMFYRFPAQLNQEDRNVLYERIIKNLYE